MLQPALDEEAEPGSRGGRRWAFSSAGDTLGEGAAKRGSAIVDERRRRGVKVVDAGGKAALTSMVRMSWPSWQQGRQASDALEGGGEKIDFTDLGAVVDFEGTVGLEPFGFCGATVDGARLLSR